MSESNKGWYGTETDVTWPDARPDARPDAPDLKAQNDLLVKERDRLHAEAEALNKQIQAANDVIATVKAERDELKRAITLLSVKAKKK